MLSTTILPFVLPSDLQTFTTLQSELNEAVQPQGALERFAFDRLVNAAWNIRRISRAEIALIEKSDGYDPLTHTGTLADAARFATLARQMETSYSRTYKELIDLQTNRALRNLDAQLPPLADQAKIARVVKQTQTNRWREADTQWKTQDAEFQQWTKTAHERESAALTVPQVRANQHSAVQTRAAEPQPPKVETVINAGPKVGRNEPCPCGSNLKFKRCCGNPVPKTAAHAA